MIISDETIALCAKEIAEWVDNRIIAEMTGEDPDKVPFPEFMEMVRDELLCESS